MMKHLLLAAAALLLAAPAFAQTAPTPAQQVDPRLAGPMIGALQALQTLREAEMKAMQQDMVKRDAEWGAYSKPLWQKPQDDSKPAEVDPAKP